MMGIISHAMIRRLMHSEIKKELFDEQSSAPANSFISVPLAELCMRLLTMELSFKD